jgi:hypothetical protein
MAQDAAGAVRDLREALSLAAPDWKNRAEATRALRELGE